jgi:hypothetical protein
MQPPVNTPSGHALETRPERPSNHLARAIILLLLLMPLCLLIGGSSFVAAWSILTGPPVRSESPAWLRALMESFKVVVALIGFFMPVAALVQAVKVNSEFDAGNYVGAAAASKSAAAYCRQSLILLVLIVLIMATDLLRYFALRKD